MYISDYALNNRKVIKGEKIGELVKYIVDKFADEGLCRDEAVIVLDHAKDAIGEYNKIIKIID